MTILDERVGPAPAREGNRRELAALVDRDPAALSDDASLRDELALDSLALMSVLTWLEARGVRVESVGHQPATVGEVLSLLEQAGSGRVSIRVAASQGINGGATDLPSPHRPAADPLLPVLSGHTFRLTPADPTDMGFLYELAVQPETCFRWRYRGAPPPPDRFAAELWKNVMVQFVARRRDEDRPVGLVVAYGADPALRHAYVGAVFRPEHTGTGLAAQAVAVFVRYLFHSFPLRKLYLEVPGFNWSQLSSGEGRLFQVEGVLREHDYYAGRFWDQRLCAIYPDAS